MQGWIQGIFQRPLGILVLIGFCFYNSAMLAVAVAGEATAMRVGALAYWIILGVGLIRCDRWAWVLCLTHASLTALVWSYVAWEVSKIGSEARLVQKIDLARVVISAMVVFYLLDGHVRRCFFKGRSQPDPTDMAGGGFSQRGSILRLL